MKTMLVIFALLITTLTSSAHTSQPPKAEIISCFTFTVNLVLISFQSTLCCDYAEGYVGSGGGGSGPSINCWISQAPPADPVALSLFDSLDVNWFWQAYQIPNWNEHLSEYIEENGGNIPSYIEGYNSKKKFIGYSGNTRCYIQKGWYYVDLGGRATFRIVK